MQAQYPAQTGSSHSPNNWSNESGQPDVHLTTEHLPTSDWLRSAKLL